MPEGLGLEVRPRPGRPRLVPDGPVGLDTAGPPAAVGVLGPGETMDAVTQSPSPTPFPVSVPSLRLGRLSVECKDF